MIFNEKNTFYWFYGIERRKTISSLPSKFLTKSSPSERKIKTEEKDSKRQRLTNGVLNKHLIKKQWLFFSFFYTSIVDKNSIVALISVFGSNKNWCVPSSNYRLWKREERNQRSQQEQQLSAHHWCHYSIYILSYLDENQCKFKAINLHRERKNQQYRKFPRIFCFLKSFLLTLAQHWVTKKCEYEWWSD